MAVQVLESYDYKCLYCSTTMQAFGPMFYDHEEPREFLEWLNKDARLLLQKDLDQKLTEWRSIQEEVEEIAGVDFGEYMSQLSNLSIVKS